MLGRLRQYQNGFALFILFCVGRVPVHIFRLLVYKYVFKIRIGENSSIHWRTVFFGPSGISIGSNTIIGNDVFLDGRAGIDVGDNVNISGHVQIFTRDHDPSDGGFGTRDRGVTIGDRAYIASRATILPGVQIGAGAVVAAGAVVVKDVPAFTIVGGVPARPIGSRPRDLAYNLKFHLPFQ